MSRAWRLPARQPSFFMRGRRNAERDALNRVLVRWVALVMFAAASVAHAAMPAAEVEQSFDVWEYQVSGNTLMESKLIERAVYPFLGPNKTIDDVEAARANLETLFRDQGYGTVLVNIPEQDVVGGVVTLAVVNGKVDRLSVTGSRYFSLGRIKSQVPSIAPGQVPNIPAVQRELAALNRASADRRITPVLRPGRNPGTVEIELKVEDELPLHGLLSFNDRYTRDTTRTRINGSLSYANLWQREHTLSFAFQTAPEAPGEVTVFSLNYLLPVQRLGGLVSVYGVTTDSDVATLGTLGVVGKGNIGGARYIRTLGNVGGAFHTLTLGLDYKDFGESINLQGGDSLNTPINYWSLLARYDLTHFGDTSTTKVGMELGLAPRILGNSPAEFESKRFHAKPNFVHLRLSFEHEQRLLPNGLKAAARLNGQVSDSPMISNEQFAFGGVESIRGYLESQQFVDDGLQGQFELISPSFAPYLPPHILQDARALAFVDGAGGRVQQPLPGNGDSFLLWSVGLGVRLKAFDGLGADLDWAYPLKKSNDGRVESGDQRVHFEVGYEF